MSVIKQTLNIVYNNGSIKRCANIAKKIKHSRNFWRECGDNLVVKSIKKCDLGWSKPGYEARRPGTEKDEYADKTNMQIFGMIRITILTVSL
ncbi:hypothetical protein NVP2275O_356 [Vibrio phage 2.275.O._10N.286.54.E11]|nr:hypothetical protein NVP2275O_356 [Vibrio phage 2.275.O._10N.286.54.E11]